MSDEHAGSVGRRRLTLAPAAQAAVDAGRFVRLELDAPLTLAKWVSTNSLLVGRAEGRMHAYANICRHQAVPLDLVMDDEGTADGEPAPAPLTDDGAMLMCLRHGALYRLSDGLCTSGPCVGQRLYELAVDEAGAILLP